MDEDSSDDGVAIDVLPNVGPSLASAIPDSSRCCQSAGPTTRTYRCGSSMHRSQAKTGLRCPHPSCRPRYPSLQIKKKYKLIMKKSSKLPDFDEQYLAGLEY